MKEYSLFSKISLTGWEPPPEIERALRRRCADDIDAERRKKLGQPEHLRALAQQSVISQRGGRP